MLFITITYLHGASSVPFYQVFKMKNIIALFSKQSILDILADIRIPCISILKQIFVILKATFLAYVFVLPQVVFIELLIVINFGYFSCETNYRIKTTVLMLDFSSFDYKIQIFL